MGRYLFRRKTVVLLSLLLALSAFCRAESNTTDKRHLPLPADYRGRNPPPVPVGVASVAPGEVPAVPAIAPATAPATASPPAGAVQPLRHSRGQSPLLELPIPDDPAVEQWRRRFLTGGTRALQDTLDRSLVFRRFISAALAGRDLPHELIYLPILESHYKVQAVSRSGATGLWQIMDNTAAPLGLVKNRWVDERRDFWRSTEGALKKLAENYALFGDWDLALAAYNCGTGKLSRTIASSGIRDFWALRDKGLLPPETASYVPKFYALASICSYPEANGLEIRWDPSPHWDRLILERSVELALLAEKAGLPLSLMEQAHAELKTPLTPPAGKRPFYLKIPAESVARVEELLADPEVQLLRFTFHTIRSGDTFYSLAEYYDQSPALLMEANPGLQPRSLQIGTQLRIPVFSGRPIKAEPIFSFSEQEAASFTAVYVVAAGDTLWDISRRHGTTAEVLAWANGRSLDALLKPGETLKVPEGEMR